MLTHLSASIFKVKPLQPNRTRDYENQEWPRVPDRKISVEGDMLWHNPNRGVSRGLDVKACRPRRSFGVAGKIAFVLWRHGQRRNGTMPTIGLALLCSLLQESARIHRARSLSRIERSRTRLPVGLRSLMCEKKRRKWEGGKIGNLCARFARRFKEWGGRQSFHGYKIGSVPVSLLLDSILCNVPRLYNVSKESSTIQRVSSPVQLEDNLD